MTEQPLLIHLHIPKNAGTTLSRMIKLRLAAWPPPRWLHHGQILGYYHVKGWRNRVARINRLPARAQRRVRFFEGHCGYGVHDLLSVPSTYIALLREPIDRTLSMYSFMLDDGKRPAEMTLDQFVSPAWNRALYRVDNAQVRYLAAEKGEFLDVPFGQVTRAMFDTAAERLESRFLLAGVTERFDESVLLLGKALGWRNCLYGRSNVTKKRLRREDVLPPTLERIADANRLDAELWQLARSRLDAQVNAAGPEFHSKLRAFKDANAAHNKRFGPMYSALPRLCAAGVKLRLVR